MAAAANELLEVARRTLASGRQAEALREASEAREKFQQAGDARGAADAFSTIIAARSAKGELQEVLAAVAEELRGCRSLNDKVGEAVLLRAVAGAHLAAGQPADALRVALEARAAASELPGGEVGLQTQAMQAVANAHMANGQVREALDVAREAIELSRRAQDKQGWAEALHLSAVIRLSTGASTELVVFDDSNAGGAGGPEADAARAALKDAYEALSLFGELRQREKEASVLNDIAEARISLGYVTEGVSAAKQALSIFRELGQRRGRQVAFDTIVHAYTASFQAPRALEVAKEELSLARSGGEQVSELAVLRAMTDIYGLMGRAQDALSTAAEAVAVSKELKNEEAVELLAVANLQRTAGRPANAQEAAEQAIAAARRTGDRASEDQAKRFLSDLHVERGNAQAAPNRAEALEALAELSAAVEGRQADAFKAALARLEALSGFTEEDVQEVLLPALERDRQSATSFLRLVGFDASGGPQSIAKEFFRGELYLGFRATGLSYGPRFRLCRPNRITRPGARTYEACAVLQVWDEQEDWIDKLCFHPGIIDSMQHTCSAVTM